MSSYINGDLRTEYIDPQVYVPNGRASFDLDASNLAYLPNMRLLNVGVTSTGDTYNRLVGSLAVVRNIRLLDGRTELSALRNPAPYLAFKSQQRTNADSKSTASWLKNTMVGLEISEADEKLGHIFTNHNTNVGQPGDANETRVGYLDLMECFPILGSLPCLPTDVFPNLRVEVEFQTSVTAQVINTQTVTDSATVRPILAVDVIENPDLAKALSKSLKDQGARWLEIEHDRFNIATNPEAAGDAQVASEQSMGYIGKRVERLLMVKTLQDPALTVATNDVMGYGNVASQAYQSQETQVRLNGRNVFPGFGGITRPNERLGLVSDEYGSCASYPGAVFYNWSNADVLMKLGAGVQLSGKAFAGALSYDCVRLGARVADLQIQISREADGGTSGGNLPPRSTNLACNVNMYAEVDKSLVMGRDGQYRIVYSA